MQVKLLLHGNSSGSKALTRQVSEQDVTFICHLSPFGRKCLEEKAAFGLRLGRTDWEGFNPRCRCTKGRAMFVCLALSLLSCCTPSLPRNSPHWARKWSFEPPWNTPIAAWEFHRRYCLITKPIPLSALCSYLIEKITNDWCGLVEQHCDLWYWPSLSKDLRHSSVYILKAFKNLDANWEQNHPLWFCNSHDLEATISVALMIYWATPLTLGRWNRFLQSTRHCPLYQSHICCQYYHVQFVVKIYIDNNIS